MVLPLIPIAIGALAIGGIGGLLFGSKPGEVKQEIEQKAGSAYTFQIQYPDYNTVSNSPFGKAGSEKKQDAAITTEMDAAQGTPTNWVPIALIVGGAFVISKMVD